MILKFWSFRMWIDNLSGIPGKSANSENSFEFLRISHFWPKNEQNFQGFTTLLRQVKGYIRMPTCSEFLKLLMND